MALDPALAPDWKDAPAELWVAAILQVLMAPAELWIRWGMTDCFRSLLWSSVTSSQALAMLTALGVTVGAPLLVSGWVLLTTPPGCFVALAIMLLASFFWSGLLWLWPLLCLISAGNVLVRKRWAYRFTIVVQGIAGIVALPYYTPFAAVALILLRRKAVRDLFALPKADAQAAR